MELIIKEKPLTQTLIKKFISAADSNAACILSGALMSLCFAPFYIWWLAWVLLIPLLLSCRHENPELRMLRGALFGIMYFGVGSYWLSFTLVHQVDFSWLAALLSNFLIAAACALAPTVFCWLLGYLNKIDTIQPIVVIALWVLIEDIRFQAFGGGPWISLGQSQIDSPFAGFFSIVGEMGTSGLVVLMNYLLLLLLKSESQQSSLVNRITIPVTMLLFLSIGYWSKQHNWTETIGSEISIAMVQSATTQDEKMNAVNEELRLQKLHDLSQRHLGNTDLIIWPETVVRLEKQKILDNLSILDQQAQKLRTTLLVGGFEANLNQGMLNTAFTLGLEGQQSYSKRHLVLFGEYVPSFLSFLDKYVPGDQFRQQGKIPKLIAINGQLLGVSICWEGAFSRDMTSLVRMGATTLINVANEAWFADSSLPIQNLDAMRMRALETGRPAVRVANMGPGAVIDSKGKILTNLKSNEAGSVRSSIQPRTGATPFVQLGEDSIMLITFILCIITAMLTYIYRRN